jgi:hypothetical protein
VCIAVECMFGGEDKDGLSPASCTAVGLKNEQSCTHYWRKVKCLTDCCIYVSRSLWICSASGIRILRKNSNPRSSTK